MKRPLLTFSVLSAILAVEVVLICTTRLSLAGPSYKSVNGMIPMPSMLAWYVDAVTPASPAVATCDSSIDVLGPIYRVGRVSGRITHVYINPYAYVAGLGLDTLFKVRLETVDADGFASGTLFTGAAEKSYSAEVDGDGLGGFWLSLGADSVTVITGDVIAQAISVSNAVASGNVSWALGLPSSGGEFSSVMPYMMKKTTATEACDDWIPIGGYKMNGVPVPCGMYPVDSILTYPAAFDVNNATYDEVGMRFKSAWAMKLGGIYFYVRSGVPATLAEVALTLYDASSTVLFSDTVGNGAFVTNSLEGKAEVLFPSDIEVLANTEYRMSLKPLTGNDVNVYCIRVTDSTDWYAFDGGGPEWYGTARVDAGSWTNFTNPNPCYRWDCGLLVSQLSADAGGFNPRPVIIKKRQQFGLRHEAMETFAGRYHAIQD